MQEPLLVLFGEAERRDQSGPQVLLVGIEIAVGCEHRHESANRERSHTPHVLDLLLARLAR